MVFFVPRRSAFGIRMSWVLWLVWTVFFSFEGYGARDVLGSDDAVEVLVSLRTALVQLTLAGFLWWRTERRLRRRKFPL